MIVIPARMYNDGLESYFDLDRVLAHPHMYTDGDSIDELDAINPFAFYAIHRRMFPDLEEKLARVRAVWRNHHNVTHVKQDSLEIRENSEYIGDLDDQEGHIEYEAEYSWAMMHTRGTGVVIIQDVQDRGRDMYIIDELFDEYDGNYVEDIPFLRVPEGHTEEVVCEWVPALEHFFAPDEDDDHVMTDSRSPEMEFVSYVHRAAALLV